MLTVYKDFGELLIISHEVLKIFLVFSLFVRIMIRFFYGFA